MPRVVADVVITIRDAEGKLSGKAMFYGRERQGTGKWYPVEKFGSALLSPRVEGKVLTFRLSFRDHDGTKKIMDYKMVMDGPDQAIFDYAEPTMTNMSAKMTRKRK
jgi:hypothetical protein